MGQTERIVTLCWGTAWDRYGKDFTDSFERHWPKDVELVIVTDQYRFLPRAREALLSNAPGYASFMARWKDNAHAQGRESRDRKATPGERFWKHDAVKWAPQGLAPRVAMDGLVDGDVLAWFDADVETIRDVPKGWLGELLNGCDVACIQRNRQHSEIGFWAIRVNAGTRRLIEIFAGLYAVGGIFRLPEYHSAYAFDSALMSCPDLRINNLNAKNLRGHVWPNTPLARFTVHKKGKIKDQ